MGSCDEKHRGGDRGEPAFVARHVKLGAERRALPYRITNRKHAAVQQRQTHANPAIQALENHRTQPEVALTIAPVG